MCGAASLEQIVETALPEVAFAGRSNVGKSSLINAITGRKALARISNAPGRTQQINFFELGERVMLVDLPGYGYAKASKSRARQWTRLVNAYLKGRAPLRRAYVLIDSRHGIKDSDRSVMAMLDGAGVSFQVVLTKCDRPEASTLAACVGETRAELARHPAAHPEVLATSARTRRDIPELRAAIATLANRG